MLTDASNRRMISLVQIPRPNGQGTNGETERTIYTLRPVHDR